MTCTASDQCHAAGTCNPATGTCSNPAAANGTACNDGNACTPTTPARAGPARANPVTCTAQRSVPRRRDVQPGDGRLLEPGRRERHACNDGNACTQSDTCQSGTCTGATPVTCTAQRPVPHRRDVQPDHGACSNPSQGRRHGLQRRQRLHDRPTPATAGPAPATTVTCTARRSVPHGRGLRSRRRGLLEPVTVANGTRCNDGNACTTGDSCQAGTCAGGQSKLRRPQPLQQTFDHFDVVPQLFGILTSTSASAAPGDLVTANFAVTNTGTFIRDSGT